MFLSYGQIVSKPKFPSIKIQLVQLYGFWSGFKKNSLFVEYKAKSHAWKEGGGGTEINAKVLRRQYLQFIVRLT